MDHKTSLQLATTHMLTHYFGINELTYITEHLEINKRIILKSLMDTFLPVSVIRSLQKKKYFSWYM